eukprot:3190167-Pleurochrysis_carterae.AAC.1
MCIRDSTQRERERERERVAKPLYPPPRSDPSPRSVSQLPAQPGHRAPRPEAGEHADDRLLRAG